MPTIENNKAYIYQDGKYKRIDGSTQLVAEYLNSESDLPTIGDPNKIYLTPANPMNAEIYNAIYPVGSIKIFYDNEDHGNFLGQTWERFGEGKTFVGIDTSDTDFDTLGKEGGAKSHTHPLGDNGAAGVRNYGDRLYVTSGATEVNSLWQMDGSTNSVWSFTHNNDANHATNEGYTGVRLYGKTESQKDLPPYIVVSYWKRIN